jgi:hypothetical protein
MLNAHETERADDVGVGWATPGAPMDSHILIMAQLYWFVKLKVSCLKFERLCSGNTLLLRVSPRNASIAEPQVLVSGRELSESFESLTDRSVWTTPLTLLDFVRCEPDYRNTQPLIF